MKIHEILSTQVQDTEFTQTMSEYERKFKNDKSQFKKIKDGATSFFLSKDKLTLLSVQEDVAIGFIELNDHGDNFYETYGLYVRPGFRGGIGLQMYEALLDSGAFLVSGDSQTAAGEAMWAKMFKLSNVKMYLYDPEVNDTFEDAIEGTPLKSIAQMRKAYVLDENGEDGEKRLIAIK